MVYKLGSYVICGASEHLRPYKSKRMSGNSCVVVVRKTIEEYSVAMRRQLWRNFLPYDSGNRQAVYENNLLEHIRLYACEPSTARVLSPVSGPNTQYLTFWVCQQVISQSIRGTRPAEREHRIPSLWVVVFRID